MGIWMSRANGGHDGYMHMYKCAQAFVAYTVKGCGGQDTGIHSEGVCGGQDTLVKVCGGQDTHTGIHSEGVWWSGHTHWHTQ